MLDSDTFVLYCGLDEFHVVTRQERLNEICAVASYFGFSWEWLAESTVNQMATHALVPVFERLMNDVRPDEVFVPYREGYNRDHATVYDAARISLRPHDQNFLVKRVFVYEEPDCLWAREPFRATYFVPFDFSRKAEGLRLHASQMRGHRSLDLVSAMSRLRGEQAGVICAEGFIVERWVV